jgi:serine/threonine protein kinase
MGKVFTITEGLENLGAMKTGGQGSVYKGRRNGTTITAIKMLPTPIYSESEEDKNYCDFQNEVEKLKRVNQEPNPHVVTILSSGITDSGNFPFIEMEYIEGPDLEELLKPPHDPIFTIKEILKIAEQLSNALAHCHKMDVKHGDVKSNNVKYDSKTGNYILLDFGLSAMSDEQRRTSLRRAGAIEFMAPEQNEGHMLFQTDVYGLGIILFELIAGQVPFPLADKSETARNHVRLAHMETPPPDMLELRKAAMPQTWTTDKKEEEMQVPEWLANMIYKCIEKKPEDRFANGIELHEYFLKNNLNASKVNEVAKLNLYPLPNDKEELLREKEQLKLKILQYEQQAAEKEKELQRLKANIPYRENVNPIDDDFPVYPEKELVTKRHVSKPVYISLFVLVMAIAAFAIFSFVRKNQTNKQLKANNNQSKIDSLAQSSTSPTVLQKPDVQKKHKKDSARLVREQQIKDQKDNINDSLSQQTEEAIQNDQGSRINGSPKYTVISKAYFHDKPDESTRRNAFIVHWNNAVLTPLDETDDFIYVVYTNDRGQTSKGWLRKVDLRIAY